MSTVAPSTTTTMTRDTKKEGHGEQDVHVEAMATETTKRRKICMTTNNSKMENVPILDMTADSNEQLEILDFALREYGFFYIKKYGFENLVRQQFEMSKLFFDPNIVSIEEKTTEMKFNPTLDIGYVGTNVQNLDQPTNRVQTSKKEKNAAADDAGEDVVESDAGSKVSTTSSNNERSATNTAEEKKDHDDDDDTAIPAVTANVPVGDTKEQFMQTNNILITTASTSTSSTSSSEAGEVTTTTTKQEMKKKIIDPYNVFDPMNGSMNYVPRNIPQYSQITNEYASCCYRLNMKLNTLLFDCLQLSQEKRLELGYQPFIVLKQMKYTSTSTSSTSKSQLVGAGEHTDWGSFTILATDNVPGLQIYHNEKWLPVPPLDNCLIINSGDQISHLTNDYYKSALHRVVINNDTTSTKSKSNNSAASAAARYSTAVFTYFDMDAIVGPLPQFISSSSAEAANDDSTSNSNNNTKATGPCKYPYRTTKEYFHFKLHESFGVV